MASWQKAGFSFNKYLAIAARTVRKSLKEDLRVAAEKRGHTDVKVQKIKEGEVAEVKNLKL